jgi:predicted amidohydrolase
MPDPALTDNSWLKVLRRCERRAIWRNKNVFWRTLIMRNRCILLTLLLFGLSSAFASDSTGIQIRVAAGQFQLEPDLKKNLTKIKDFLTKAAAKKVDLIVFPELSLTGYPPKGIESLNYVDQGKTEEALKYLQKRAVELSIAIAVGAAWKDEKDIWHNRAFFIDENGEILEHYDKIQQTSHERKFFIDGERLPTFHWRGIKLGMLICMDMRYPELWRLMRKDNVQLMLHLLSAYGGSVWKVPVLDGTMRCRAAENGYYIVSCNNAGPAPMMISAIYNQIGLVLAKANYAVEEIIISDMIIKESKGYIDFHDDIYNLQKTSKE